MALGPRGEIETPRSSFPPGAGDPQYRRPSPSCRNRIMSSRFIRERVRGSRNFCKEPSGMGTGGAHQPGGHQFVSKYTTVHEHQSTWSRLTGAHQGQCLPHLSATRWAARLPVVFPSSSLSCSDLVVHCPCPAALLVLPDGAASVGPDLPGGDTKAHRPRGTTDFPRRIPNNSRTSTEYLFP